MKPHLFVINNLPVFYRTPAFAALQTAWLRETGGGFTVLYQSRRDVRRRDESFFTPDLQLPYDHVFLSEDSATSNGRSHYATRIGLDTWLRNRPSHVLTAGWDTPASVASQLYRRLGRARLCLWSESTAATSSRGGRVPSAYRRWCANGGDSYIFPTLAAKSWLEEVCGHDLHCNVVLPNPVQGDRLPEDGDRAMRFLFVGELSTRKGYDLVCEAMRKRPEWLCLAFGRRADVPTEAEPANVLWQGSMPFVSILAKLRSVDVLLIPSRADPAPLTFSEGLMLGLRMVVSPTIAYGAEHDAHVGIAVPRALTVSALLTAMEEARASKRPSATLSKMVQADGWAEQVLRRCLL